MNLFDAVQKRQAHHRRELVHARAELIDEIVERNFTIEVAGEPEFVDSNFVNGIEHLEVRIR